MLSTTNVGENLDRNHFQQRFTKHSQQRVHAKMRNQSSNPHPKNVSRSKNLTADPNSYWCQPDSAKAYNVIKEISSMQKEACDGENGTEAIYMEIIKMLVTQLKEARKEVKELKEGINLQGAVTKIKIKGQRTNNR